MVTTSDEKIILIINYLWKISTISEKELREINFKGLKNALVYIKNNLIDSDDKMYLIVDILIDINNIITGLNNIFLKKVNIKPFGYDEMYMEKDLIKNNLYQLIVQFNKREINHVDFYSELVNNTHSFYYGNGRTYKIFNFNLYLICF